MLAELHGKLDSDGLGGLDPSEDLLTAAVFGAVRHLPRAAVLGRLLEEIGVHCTPAQMRPLSSNCGQPSHVRGGQEGLSNRTLS